MLCRDAQVFKLLSHVLKTGTAVGLVVPTCIVYHRYNRLNGIVGIHTKLSCTIDGTATAQLTVAGTVCAVVVIPPLVDDCTVRAVNPSVAVSVGVRLQYGACLRLQLVPENLAPVVANQDAHTVDLGRIIGAPVEEILIKMINFGRIRIPLRQSAWKTRKRYHHIWHPGNWIRGTRAVDGFRVLWHVKSERVGYSNTFIPFSSSHARAKRLVWIGALSCINSRPSSHKDGNWSSSARCMTLRYSHSSLHQDPYPIGVEYSALPPHERHPTPLQWRPSLFS